MIGIEIYNLLSSDNAITDIVVDRIYPQNAKSNSIPCVIYEIDNLEQEMVFTSGVTGDYTCNLRVSCVAPEYAITQTMSLAVIQLLSNYSNGRIGRIFYESNEENSIIDPNIEDQISFYESVLTFKIFITNN